MESMLSTKGVPVEAVDVAAEFGVDRGPFGAVGLFHVKGKMGEKQKEREKPQPLFWCTVVWAAIKLRLPPFLSRVT